MGLFGKAKGEELVVGIEGMSCMHCVGKVEKGLKEMDGVISAEVNLDKKKATVQYDASKVGPEQIRKKIVEVGYQVV